MRQINKAKENECVTCCASIAYISYAVRSKKPTILSKMQVRLHLLRARNETTSFHFCLCYLRKEGFKNAFKAKCSKSKTHARTIYYRQLSIFSHFLGNFQINMCQNIFISKKAMLHVMQMMQYFSKYANNSHCTLKFIVHLPGTYSTMQYISYTYSFMHVVYAYVCAPTIFAPITTSYCSMKREK